MATNFPGSLDSFTNPSASDAMDSVTVPHADQHANLNDAVEALQSKVGVDGSAVTSSLDYKVANQGLVLVGSYTATNASQLIQDGVFTSQFTNYRMVMYLPRCDDDLYFRFRTSNSDSTTGYQYVLHGLSSTGAAGSSYASSGAGKIVDLNVASSVGRNTASFDIISPYVNDYSTYTGTSQGYVAGGNYYHFHMGCVHTVTGQRDGFRLFPNSGLFSYTVTLYGYNEG